VIGDSRKEEQCGGQSRAPRYAWVPLSAIEDHQHMPDAAFRVYCYLRSLADPEGYCWASGATIASALGKARSTVMDHVSTLERLGWARRLPAFRTDGGKAANRYWVSREISADVSHVRPTDMGERGGDRQQSPLLPVNGASSPMSARRSSYDGRADMACPAITDTDWSRLPPESEARSLGLQMHRKAVHITGARPAFVSGGT